MTVISQARCRVVHCLILCSWLHHSNTIALSWLLLFSFFFLKRSWSAVAIALRRIYLCRDSYWVYLTCSTLCSVFQVVLDSLRNCRFVTPSISFIGKWIWDWTVNFWYLSYLLNLVKSILVLQSFIWITLTANVTYQFFLSVVETNILRPDLWNNRIFFHVWHCYHRSWLIRIAVLDMQLELYLISKCRDLSL